MGLLVLLAPGLVAAQAPAPPSLPAPPAAPAFTPATRSVSTWRTEAAGNLEVSPEQAAAFRAAGPAPPVARCVKLNNYWCIKKAGWRGEIAADAEGHVAFDSAEAGAAVAALLLKRYYVDLGRKTATAIISHWAPAQCGLVGGGLVAATAAPRRAGRAPKGLAATLRGRWLAGHARGFVTPVGGRRAPAPRRSIVADRVERTLATPTIAAGLGVPTRPMTLDALLRASPNAPPSRSMLGAPRRPGTTLLGGLAGDGCAGDATRIAAYAGKAAAGLPLAAGGDLALFAADGTPTANLARMMTNMAQVEIGPLGAKPDLVTAGIAAAFRPGRDAPK